MTWTLANVTNAYLHRCVPLGLDCLENGSRGPQQEELNAIGDCPCLNPTRQWGRWLHRPIVWTLGFGCVHLLLAIS